MHHHPTAQHASTSKTRLRRAASLVSITLKSDLEGLSVQAVEITSAQTLTRSDFRERRDLDSVLNPALGRQVEALAVEAGGNAGILSKPEFSLALPGVVLNSVRVMVSRLYAGFRYVNVRFQNCFGNVTAVFSDQMRPWHVGYDQAVLIAAETLEKIFVPLKNLAAYLDNAPRAHSDPDCPVTEALRATRRRIDELDIYYTMLADFVASQSKHPARRSHEAVVRIATSEI